MVPQTWSRLDYFVPMDLLRKSIALNSMNIVFLHPFGTIKQLTTLLTNLTSDRDVNER